jgi:hypothetical protein
MAYHRLNAFGHSLMHRRQSNEQLYFAVELKKMAKLSECTYLITLLRLAFAKCTLTTLSGIKETSVFQKFLRLHTMLVALRGHVLETRLRLVESIVCILT